MSETELLLAPGDRQRLVGHLLQLEAEAALAERLDRLQPATTTTARGMLEPSEPARNSDDHQQAYDPTPSVVETAELLGICRWLVQQAVHDGSLPGVRGGRRTLIRRDRLLAWLEVTDAVTEPALSADFPGHRPPLPGHDGLNSSWRAALVGAPRNPGLWTADRGRPDADHRSPQCGYPGGHLRWLASHGDGAEGAVPLIQRQGGFW